MVRGTEEGDGKSKAAIMGSLGFILEARRAADTAATGPADAAEVCAQARWRTQAQRCACGIRGDRVRIAYRLPMEGVAGRAVRQRQCHPQTVPGMGQGRFLRCAMASRTGRVRRDGGYRLAMAEHRRGITEGAAGPRVGGAEPHRAGKKMEASGCCWSTPVASRCRSSWPRLIATM